MKLEKLLLYSKFACLFLSENLKAEYNLDTWNACQAKSSEKLNHYSRWHTCYAKQILLRELGVFKECLLKYEYCR